MRKYLVIFASSVFSRILPSIIKKQTEKVAPSLKLRWPSGPLAFYRLVLTAIGLFPRKKLISQQIICRAELTGRDSGVWSLHLALILVIISLTPGPVGADSIIPHGVLDTVAGQPGSNGGFSTYVLYGQGGDGGVGGTGPVVNLPSPGSIQPWAPPPSIQASGPSLWGQSTGGQDGDGGTGGGLIYAIGGGGC